MDLYEKLSHLIRSNADIYELLQCLRQIDSAAYFSAGLIRNWIWSYLHNQNYSIFETEIDVIYFDPSEKMDERRNYLKDALQHRYPNIHWDITNQALVHHWYRTDEGAQIDPYTSVHHAMSFWPETATAIAIKLKENNHIEILAPLGLEDLFTLKLRWNNRLVSRGVFEHRVKSKCFLERWPELSIVN